MCGKSCRTVDEVCGVLRGVYRCAHVRTDSHTKLGITQDSKGAFEVF